MRSLCRSLTLVPLVLWLLGGSPLAASWAVEDRSAIGFTATQQGRPVDGHFETFSAAIDFDPDDLAASRIEVVIDVASIATGHRDRDLTLRSPAFFDVARWPSARFASDEIEHRQDERYEARGTLTMRDVTRDVVLPFALAIAPHPETPGALQARAAGELTVRRLDYGIGQGDFASTATVGDDVVIRIEVVARRPR
jgi:polyisoprenoid-binding protein YceI